MVLILGLGNYVAAEIGKLVGEGGPLSTFGGVAIMAFIAGICLWLMADKLVDWMHGAEGHDDKEQLLEEELEITGEKQ